ncbi:MAG: hypothetical protein M1128_02750, partial [Candidatus Marsarchaeota archaeon]|nr:hypothetical protein [Candidatus Marsarchaeota archaeon]
SKTATELMLKSEGERGTVDSFMQRTIVRLKKSNPKKMRNLTNPFIPAASRPKSWEELKNDLLAMLEDFQNDL